MGRRRKKRLKKIAFIAVPIVVVCVISYVSITSHPHASETTYEYEHYYVDSEHSEYSDKHSEYDNISNDMSEENATMTQFDGTKDKPIEEIDYTPDDIDTDSESVTVLVNKELALPTDYIPKDLVVPNVKFSINYYDEKKLMRKEAADALETLFQDATNNNIILYGISAYRSYERQNSIFTTNIRSKGLSHTMKYSAKPGCSEHQTGLAIDVSAKSANNRLDSSFADTAEGKWLAENSHLYGYIIRYPDGKSQITGYSYEPWHIRYVGVSLATYLYEKDLTLEEYYGFVPTVDYSNEISYDNLTDYGIDIDDVTNKSSKPTPEVTNVPEGDELSEEELDTDTREDENSNIKNTKDKNSKDKNSKDKNSKGKNSKSDNSQEVKDDTKDQDVNDKNEDIDEDTLGEDEAVSNEDGSNQNDQNEKDDKDPVKDSDSDDLEDNTKPDEKSNNTNNDTSENPSAETGQTTNNGNQVTPSITPPVPTSPSSSGNVIVVTPPVIQLTPTPNPVGTNNMNPTPVIPSYGK